MTITEHIALEYILADFMSQEPKKEWKEQDAKYWQKREAILGKLHMVVRSSEPRASLQGVV